MPPQPRLRYGVLTALSLGALFIGYLLWTVLPTLLTRAVTPGSEETSTIAIPPVQEQAPRDYTRYGPKEETAPAPAAVPPPPAAIPPMAQLLQRSMLTGTTESQERLAQQQGVILAGILDLMQFLKREREEKAQQLDKGQTVVQAPTQSQTPTGRQQGAQAPTKKTVKYLAVPEQGTEPGKLSEGQEKEAKRVGEAQDLIHRAKWAIPEMPLRTIYKSQTLAGRLQNSLSSDIPGIAKIELTIPLYDKFGYSHMILDKGTLVIAKQEGRPEYGNTRLKVVIDQLELVTGEVVKLQAVTEDAEGKTGLTGRVNNHVAKLIGATLINAAISLGSNSLAGTPSGFYQNPAQQAARETSQSVSNDIRSITSQQLKVPPTIDIPAGIPVLIQLDENVQFNYPAVVAR